MPFGLWSAHTEKVANGWITIDRTSNAVGLMIVPTASLRLIGSLAQAGTSADMFRTFPNAGTDTSPDITSENIHSIDTYGRIILLLGEAKDLQETTNVIDDPAYACVRAELDKLVADYRARFEQAE